MGEEITDAMAIAEGCLSQTTKGLMTDDFELFAAVFHVPHKIETFEGVRYIETTEALRETFEALVQAFARLSVTDNVRRVIAAEFHAPDWIVSTHETRLMNGPIMVVGPYPVISSLRLFDGVWKVAESSYALGEHPVLNAALNGRKP